MCKLDFAAYEMVPTTAADLWVPPRSRSRSLKPCPPRKVSAPARIDLNRFWNEMEEFYDR